METKEIRKLEKEKLVSLIEEKVNEYIDFDRKLRSGEERNNSKSKVLRKDIARLKTILREKEILELVK
jgi:large subunit ribosomal protein L29